MLVFDATVLGTVMVGGSESVRLSREDYDYAVLASKPSAMTLRFMDKLFSKEVLLRSTLYGTKELSALDPSKIAAIKGTVAKRFLFLLHSFKSSYMYTILKSTKHDGLTFLLAWEIRKKNKKNTTLLLFLNLKGKRET